MKLNDVVGLEIKESFEELRRELSKHKDYRYSQLIESLIFFVDGSGKNRQSIAICLGVDRKTLRKWYKMYQSGGLKELLNFKHKGSQSKKNTPEIHEALQVKLHDSARSLLGYRDVVRWLREEYSLDVNCYSLRIYIRKHFKAKLKAPRKSHYKKDVAAQEAYKKIQQMLDGHKKYAKDKG